ncbi:MAG: 4-hydroxy-3-methylbut-2-enyl diphosphate reductase [Rikenellaceae bacterium]
MRVEIDPKSGFCFGVVRAISEAERALQECGSTVFSLGDIVHNRVEVQRLAKLGLEPISELLHLTARGEGKRVLIRAHGEPPATYELARQLGVEVIDATCPVVAKLQQRVVAAFEKMQSVGGQVVLLGKRGHAEVVGLTGQVNDEVIVVERIEDIESGQIDFGRAIYLLSQTTQSIALFEELAQAIKQRAESGVEVEVCDTICRQVSSREEHLKEFVARFDVVIFVCGKKSSNGKVLFELCRDAKAAEGDERCYNIECEEEIDPKWFEGAESVGICGATSTPAWLMERVARAIEKL